MAQTNALFEEYWEWVLRENPEWATSLGDRRYDDRLKDESAQAVRRRTTTRVDFRSRLGAIDTAALPPELRTSVRVLRDQLDRSAAIAASFGDLPFGVFDGWAPDVVVDGTTRDRPPHFTLGLGLDDKILERHVR